MKDRGKKSGNREKFFIAKSEIGAPNRIIAVHMGGRLAFSKGGKKINPQIEEKMGAFSWCLL